MWKCFACELRSQFVSDTFHVSHQTIKFNYVWRGGVTWAATTSIHKKLYEKLQYTKHFPRYIRRCVLNIMHALYIDLLIVMYVIYGHSIIKNKNQLR